MQQLNELLKLLKNYKSLKVNILIYMKQLKQLLICKVNDRFKTYNLNYHLYRNVRQIL